MAWTSWGFDGTINEAQWAQMAGLLGNGYVAAGNGDCLVTAVGGARSVSVAAGSLYGDGVVSVNSAAETVAMTTPVNGQWYVIALRRTWATNTAALVAIAGATTTTTTPTAPPTSFPTLNTNVGVLTDQPIAWAWCNSANTTVVVFDIRLKAVKSLPPVVANATERDAKFMTPTQGLQVWRDDLGATQTYYGLYNSSTNPGGRDAAGWYSNDRLGGLIPVKPSTLVVASGTASANSMGLITFSGATALELRGVFSSEYRRYKIIADFRATNNGVLWKQYMNGATPLATGTPYAWGGDGQNGAAQAVFYQVGYATCWAMDMGQWWRNSLLLEEQNPCTSDPVKVAQMTATWNNGNMLNVHSGAMADNATVFDGLKFYTSVGSIEGTIQVFGYND